MSDCLLSVIIPAYNAQKFIDNLLKKLLKQSESIENIEIIVVNDGSKDSTQSIVEDFVKDNKKIILINQENKGESGARNAGISAAKGKYLYFLDSDDDLEDGTLPFYIKALSENLEIQVFAFGYNSFYHNEKSKSYVSSAYDKNKLSQEEFIKLYLSKEINCHICSIISERTLIQSCPLQFLIGLKIGADIDFLLRLFAVTKSFMYFSRSCYRYMIRDDSIMQGYKTYSKIQYHSFEIRRDLCLNEFYQSKRLRKYSNFWIENQLLSNIVYYLKSSFCDDEITQNLIKDCQLLKRPISKGNLKNYLAIKIVKILPLKTIIKHKKRTNC